MRREDFKISELETHPAANVFPMMGETDLAELAEDIKANGLKDPVVLYRNGADVPLLIDGRNRTAACKLAGIEPHHVWMEEGADPVDYVWSKNGTRRHITKGQRAMAYAQLHPKPKNKGGRGKTAQKNGEVSGEYVRMGRTILAYSDLVSDVVQGITPLAKAHEEAQKRKRENEHAKEGYAMLQQKASDLAALVVDEQLSLKEGLAAYEERERNAEMNRRAYIMRLKDYVDLAETFMVHPDQTAKDMHGHADEIERYISKSIDEICGILEEFSDRPICEILRGMK